MSRIGLLCSLFAALVKISKATAQPLLQGAGQTVLQRQPNPNGGSSHMHVRPGGGAQFHPDEETN